MIVDQEHIKSKFDELIRRLEYFDRNYQNVPLRLAKDIRDLVIGEQSDEILTAVMAEYKRATSLHGSFNSTHEGYAIIKEEVDELWDEVKKNGSSKALQEEAIQIAAMAIRFCTDLAAGENDDN